VVILPLCKCGCGKRVSKPKNKYINGHSSRGRIGYWKGKKRPEFSGINHPNFGKRYNHREDTIEKIRQIMIDRKISEVSKRKMSVSATDKFKKRPDLRYKCGWQRFTLERIIKEYSFLFDYEDIRENKYGNLEFRCKNCREWFSPTGSQISERIRAIKQNIKLIHQYLYCSEDCKKNCKYYNRHSDPDEYEKLKKYRMLVTSETDRSLRHYKNKIKNIHLRGDDYHLDHKFSVYEGFMNNIDPHIIGHWRNLEIVTRKINRKKSYACSITLNELKRLIDKK